MAEARQSAWWKSPAVALSISGAAGALIAAATLSRESKNPADITIFLGRFHPLLVHLPIGALVLVVLLESLTVFPKYRERVQTALLVALPAAVLFAATSFVLGLLLARGGGYSASTVAWHRGLTLASIVALAATTVAFVAATTKPSRLVVYRTLLAITMGVLTVGAHFGGTLSRGGDYLTRFAPAQVKKLLGVSEPAEAPKAAHAEGADRLVYQDVVAPILERTCVGCHGPKTVKAKLRLDSLDAIMKGGESGPAAIPGNGAASPLYARLVLPETADDHMPPPDHPAPTEAERELLKWWIDRGANDTLRVADALPPSSARALLEGAAGTEASAPAPSAPSAAPSAGSAPHEAISASAEPSAEASAPPPAPLVLPHPSADGLVYRDRVAPILSARCGSCHGAARQKGKLRVDSLAAMVTGGASGAAISPGHASSSLLLSRVHLPITSEDHMPPAKAPQPTDDEVETVAFWIDRGATEDLKVADLPAKLRGAAPPKPTPLPPPSATASSPAPPPSAPPTAPPVTPSSTPDRPPRQLPETMRWEADVIAPLLKQKCGACHAGSTPIADFRVDDMAALKKGGFGGPALIAGHPDLSLMVHRLELAPSDDDHMPPVDSPQLSPGELQLVSDWIKGGATDAPFQPASLSPAERAALGDLTPPASTGPAPVPSASASAAPPASSSSASTGAGGPNPPPGVHGGSCAACAIGGVTDGALPGALALALAIAAFGRRATSTR